MRVPSDAEGSGGSTTGPFAELLRLQTELQARLTEETLRYFRRIGGALGPASPGTVVLPEEGLELAASGSPGGGATLSLEVDNLQRVHCVLSPALTPLVSASGVTWFPEVEPAAGASLLAPGETGSLALDVRIPADLPPDIYRGALLLQGFRQSALPVAVTISAMADKPAAAPKKRAARRPK